MQQTGTLKKRRRRNIAKVTGLSSLQYNEAEDNYDGTTLFSSSRINPVQLQDDTRIRISSLLERSRSAQRVTRDAAFHMEMDIDQGEVDYDKNPTPSKTVSLFSTNSIIDRPYFLDKSTMARLRQTLILGMFTISYPWRWNAKEHRVDKYSPFWEKLWSILSTLIFIQTCFLTIFQFKCFFKAITNGDTKNHRGMFMSSFSVIWYCLNLLFNINMMIYKEQIREYINTLFNFNREFVAKYVVDLDDYVDGGRMVINLSIPSNTCQVFVSASFFLMMPYQPWYLFSFIYPKPWYWLIPGAMHEFVVVGQVIANYCLYQWTIVAHANSMEFWLRESHRKNDSGYTIEEFRNAKTAVETYRTLQILATLFNDCMAPMAWPIMKISIGISLIPCGYVFIRSMNHLFIEEFPGILTYPVSIIDCASTGFATLSLAAVVYDLGCGFVDSWMQTRHKHFRRILMSCPTLKVKVGKFYCITVSTTITFFQLVWGYIVDCIITFP